MTESPLVKVMKFEEDATVFYLVEAHYKDNISAIVVNGEQWEGLSDNDRSEVIVEMAESAVEDFACSEVKH